MIHKAFDFTVFKLVERDFNHLISKQEKMRLGKKLQNNIVENSESSDAMKAAVDCLAKFARLSVSNFEQVPNYSESIEAEAELIVNLFLDGYHKAIDEKKVDLSDFLCISEMNVDEIKKLSENFTINLSDLNFGRCGEKDLEEIVESIYSQIEHLQKGESKGFLKPDLTLYIYCFLKMIRQCIQDVKGFNKEFDIHLTDDGELRCLLNYLNLYFHRFCFTKKLKPTKKHRKVMFAASILHPLQDDFIDQYGASEEMIAQIEKKLRGEEVTSKHDLIAKIYEMIDIIYGAYPIKKNPILKEIFVNLNEWQKISLDQKKDKLTEDEILRISFMKGGYAFAFFGYIAFGKLDMAQFRHFFGMGSIYQISDDFQDIETDVSDHIDTIFTRKIRGKQNLDDVLFGLVGVHSIFEEITPLVDSLIRPVTIRGVVLFVLRLDIVKSCLMNQHYFSYNFIELFKTRYEIDVTDYLSHYKSAVDNLKTLDDLESKIIIMNEQFVRKGKNSKGAISPFFSSRI